MSVSPVDTSSNNAWYISGQRPTPPPLTNTSDLLGLSAADIEEAQKDGKSLAALAAEKGVSSNDVVASVTQDLQGAAPQGAPAPSADQLAQTATDIVNGTRPAHAHHAHHAPPTDDTDEQADDDRSLQNLTNVAQSMGTDLNSLLEQLSSTNGSSDDIVSLLTQSNSANYGTSLSDLISGGLSVDTYA